MSFTDTVARTVAFQHHGLKRFVPKTRHLYIILKHFISRTKKTEASNAFSQSPKIQNPQSHTERTRTLNTKSNSEAREKCSQTACEVPTPVTGARDVLGGLRGRALDH